MTDVLKDLEERVELRLPLWLSTEFPFYDKDDVLIVALRTLMRIARSRRVNIAETCSHQLLDVAADILENHRYTLQTLTEAQAVASKYHDEVVALKTQLKALKP